MRDSTDNYSDNEVRDAEELDAPIFIFPDDNPSDDDDNADSSSSSETSEISSLGGLFSSRLFASSGSDDNDDDRDDSGSDDGSSRLTFGRVHATKKEKEFVFMPFLDDEGSSDDDDDDDDDEGEESSLSFGRVHAAKKEKEFVFMPFLNISDDSSDDSDTSEQKSYIIRPDGTVFDEGIILLPLSPIDDDDDEDNGDLFDIADDHEDDDDFDSGIYVTDATPEELARRPQKRPTPSTSGKRSSSQQNTKKKSQQRPAPSRQGQQKKSKSKTSSSMPSAEEQFRAAMMNINPEIRRAAMRDPIQRAALEQAVRIALVQQAAQEAVARTTGSPGGYGNNGYSSPNNQQRKKSKKKRPAASAQTTAQSHSNAAQNTSVRGFSLGGFSSAPADFGVVTPPSAPTAPAQTVANTADEYTRNANESFEFNPTPTGSPDVIQDPVLASLSATVASAARTAPAEQQDPALASLSGSSSSSGAKQITSYSPAAIRAAMRAGIDLSLPQTAAAAASATQSSSSAQKAKLMESVNSRRSGCLIWLIVLFIVFFVGLLAIAVWPSLSTELKYQDASTLMADGMYIEASEIFSQLDDYKDSKVKANEAVYVYALALQNEGKYEKAIEYYSTITSYSTTSERIAECRYILGKQFMAEGDYEAAYDQLYHIPRYNDAGDLAKESNYQCAMQLYREGSYASAMVRFGMFPDYLDSADYWRICQYENASALLVAGDYQDAYDQFSELGDYQDSEFKTAMAQYYLIVDGDSSFTLDEIRASLAAIEAEGSNYARELLESNIYTAAKFEGAWYDEAGTTYIIYNAGIESPTLTFCFSDEDNLGTEIVVSGVRFDNNLAYYMHGDNQTMLLRIEGFDPDESAAPGTVTVYNFSNEETYTLYRNGQQ